MLLNRSTIQEGEDEVPVLNNEQKEYFDQESLEIKSDGNTELTFIPDFIWQDFTNFQCHNDNFTCDLSQELDILSCDPIKQMEIKSPMKKSEPKYFELTVTQELSNKTQNEDEMELTINNSMYDTLFINSSTLSRNDATLNFRSEHVKKPPNSGSIGEICESSKNIGMNEVIIEKNTDEIDILLSIKTLFQQSRYDSASNLFKADENILFVRYLFNQCFGSKNINSRGKIIQDVPQSEICDELYIDNLFKGNYGSADESSLIPDKKMQLLPYVNLDMKFNMNRILINLIPPMVHLSQIKWLHKLNLPLFKVNLNKIQSKNVTPFIIDKQQSTNLYTNCKTIMRKKSIQCITEETEYEHIEDVCNKIDEAVGDACSYKDESSRFVTAFVENEIPYLKVKNKKNSKTDNKLNKQGLLRGYFSKMGRGMLNKHDKGENKENREIIIDKSKKSQPVLKDINEFKLFSLLKKVKEKEKVKAEKKEQPTPNSSRKKFWTLPANNKITRRNQNVTNKDDFHTKDNLIKRNWDFFRDTFTKKT